MVTVAELTEKYIKKELDNEQFYAQLKKLYGKQIDEAKLKKLIESLEAELSKLEKESKPSKVISRR